MARYCHIPNRREVATEHVASYAFPLFCHEHRVRVKVGARSICQVTNYRRSANRGLRGDRNRLCHDHSVSAFMLNVVEFASILVVKTHFPFQRLQRP